MTYDVEVAVRFRAAVRLVGLDDLLTRAPELEGWYNELAAAHDEERVAWLAEAPQCNFVNYGKPSLLGRVADLGEKLPAATRKEDVLARLLRLLWERTVVAESYAAVRKDHNRLQEWADDLREVPEQLKRVISGGDEVFEEWRKESSQDLVHAALAMRGSRTADLMGLARAVPVARRGLGMLEKGRSHAEVVYVVFDEVQSLVMGTIGSNLAPTGQGMDHAAALWAARRLTWAMKKVIPREARPFVSTMHAV